MCRATKVRWGFVASGVFVGLLGLAVVLSIILPNLGGVSKEAAATTQATNIHRALLLYANDHDGRFPEAMTHANDAFRHLFREYLSEENLFHVPGSAWHAATGGRGPDNIIGLPPNWAYTEALKSGENHWAYVSGLRPTSDSRLPLIADGFVVGSPGTYTDDPSQKGGVWKGRFAIVVLVSGAADRYPLSKKSGYRVFRQDPATGEQADVFRFPSSLSGGALAKVFNPQ